MSKRTKKHGRNVIKANRKRNSIPPALKKKFKEQDKKIQQIKKRDKLDTVIYYIIMFLMLSFCVVLVALLIYFRKFHG